MPIEEWFSLGWRYVLTGEDLILIVSGVRLFPLTAESGEEYIWMV
ncbi:MAG: hypothetical protein N3E47_01835 [Candidatus Bathyarchaeota archaeon]|nr:hypothetical protein [Candidatus Bathyarchaeota archaeon]